LIKQRYEALANASLICAYARDYYSNKRIPEMVNVLCAWFTNALPSLCIYNAKKNSFNVFFFLFALTLETTLRSFGKRIPDYGKRFMRMVHRRICHRDAYTTLKKRSFFFFQRFLLLVFNNARKKQRYEDLENASRIIVNALCAWFTNASQR